jgi:hypothetical protein
MTNLFMVHEGESKGKHLTDPEIGELILGVLSTPVDDTTSIARGRVQPSTSSNARGTSSATVSGNEGNGDPPDSSRLRYHFTSVDELKVSEPTIGVKPGGISKPSGLWYTFDKTRWKEYAQENLSHMFNNPEVKWYIHTFTLKPDAKFVNIRSVKKNGGQSNTGHVLSISSIEDVKILYNVFGDGRNGINWNVIQENFAGIEIGFNCDRDFETVTKDNTSTNYRRSHLILYAFDVCSGAIWNTKIVDFDTVKTEEVEIDVNYDSDFTSEEDDDNLTGGTVSGGTGAAKNSIAFFASMTVQLLIVVASSLVGSLK